MTSKIAALFVAANGCYYNLPDVEPWGIPDRDARLYDDPYPVVAHPPCERWGRYWSGGPSSPKRYKLGDDGGCFASALASVRRCGGVLEHPQGSQAWRAFGLLAPPKSGGWVPAGDGLGYTCCVSQGWYGHLAQKPTWLYAVRCELPPLIWGRAPDHWRNDPTRSERWKARAEKEGVTILLSRKQRAATPLPFRDLLLEIARTVR